MKKWPIWKAKCICPACSKEFTMSVNNEEAQLCKD